MDDTEQTVGAPTDPDGTDPDGDGPVPVRRRQLRHAPVAVLLLAVISAGGAVGACARYGASLVWPTMPGTFPWTTWAVNTAGCAAIGVLMVLITDVRTVHPLVRPFLGTGVLGGFTTFSTYALDAQRLVDGGRTGLALAYLVLSVLAALGAVWAAAAAMRWFVARTRRVAGRRA
ncbi:chromosome condensation protein CrcB [Frankia sp. CcI156]|uniref:fluoride efflux transporter FluC n=1 Tax=Frankia TaxID=1854 RepID=UPI000053B9E1|nr:MULTISPECIES: CrcB family protein [Frankia]ABD11692.1 camphor resistance protein CrcB [Frankia casuarinae]ETA03474.1 camphor resistance protein CrcB [Frankia sp. CcI6]EYT90024.1 camphor resistance protein CrcB [Frankia casuarinae]KDA40966.1 camphor resistance protein CrcB [Frankia sp. BMG5.23]KFB03627.1 camphor resistance protein CrcB [Frankia sp. Allo2]